MDSFDPHLRRVFKPRQRRSFLHFRRRRDLVFFITCVSGFLVGVTSLGFAVWIVRARPAPAAAPRLERRPAPPSPAPQPAAPPEAAPPPALEIPAVSTAAAVPAEPPPKPFSLLTPEILYKREADVTAELLAKRLTSAGLHAVEMRYKLREGRWVRLSFKAAVDLRGARRLQISFRGVGRSNNLELGVIDADGTVAVATWPKATAAVPWTTEEDSVKAMTRFGGDGELDWGKVRSFYLRVSKGRTGEGGSGTVYVRGVRFLP